MANDAIGDRIYCAGWCEIVDRRLVRVEHTRTVVKDGRKVVVPAPYEYVALTVRPCDG